MMPESLKRTWRGLRLLLTSAPPAAPELPQVLVNDCRVFNSRLSMLSELPKNALIAEVGTLSGSFAREILKRNEPKELHLIDADFSKLDLDVRFAPAVTLHEGLSDKILVAFEDLFFDWIYIDADHTYKNVSRDIEAAAQKVKAGGYLVFNDFARIVRPGLGVFGVHQAVCEFAIRRGWKFSYFCLHGEALYDVALKKPEIEASE